MNNDIKIIEILYKIKELKKQTGSKICLISRALNICIKGMKNKGNPIVRIVLIALPFISPWATLKYSASFSMLKEGRILY